MSTKSKKVAYTLVIDEDRDNAMSIMTSHIFNRGLKPALLNWLEEEGLKDVYLQMEQEISDKQHELGWCKAPDCAHPNAKHQQGYEQE